MNDIIIDGVICKYCNGRIEDGEEFEDAMITHLLSFHPEMKKLEIEVQFGKSGLVDLIVKAYTQPTEAEKCE